ncbi:PP2C family protein-serine/threonine phosphatase [Kitasatospora sp. NPDC093806]|uniref:PP2C family protein-serine/threonine phosphatase n=1 Tax=Kitasatospora sp. NPDC093806 TaxID=3155075 RepID=UPI00343E6D86
MTASTDGPGSPERRRDGAVPPPRLPRRARLLLYGAFLLLLAAVLVDLITGPGTTLSPVLAVAPVLVSATTRRARVPLATGAVAIVVAGLLEEGNTHLPGSVHATALVTITAATLASTANVVLTAARERELLQVRTVAEAAQRALLRPPPERVGPLRIAVRYVAAAAEARIGGDLYAVADTPFGIRVLLGDVQGHGLPAVETAADVLGAFRTAARTEPDLARLAERLDAALSSRPANERFATALLIGVDRRSGAARLVNCGHPHPLLRRAGQVTELAPAGHAPPLGLLDLAGDSHYQAVPFEPQPGDLLVLHTDGVSEARDPAGTFYPLPTRLATFPAGSPDDLLDDLFADLARWVSPTGLADDAAALALRWER